MSVLEKVLENIEEQKKEFLEENGFEATTINIPLWVSKVEKLPKFVNGLKVLIDKEPKMYTYLS